MNDVRGEERGVRGKPHGHAVALPFGTRLSLLTPHASPLTDFP